MKKNAVKPKSAIKEINMALQAYCNPLPIDINESNKGNTLTKSRAAEQLRGFARLNSEELLAALENLKKANTASSNILTIAQLSWPLKPGYLDKLPFNGESLERFVKLLVLCIKDSLLEAQQLTDARVNSSFKEVIHIIKDHPILTKEQRNTLGYHVTSAMIEVRLFESASSHNNGQEFYFVCHNYLIYPEDSKFMCGLVSYLIKQNLEDAFSNNEKILLITALLSLPNSAVQKTGKDEYVAFVNETVLPFVISMGFKEQVHFKIPNQGFFCERLQMKGMDMATCQAIVNRFRDYIIYRGHVAKEIDNVMKLSLSEYQVKIPLAKMLFKSHFAAIEHEKSMNARTAAARAGDVKQYGEITNHMRSVLQEHDLSSCIREIIGFLNNKETMLAPDCRAYCLMKVLSPIINFDFSGKSVLLRKSPEKLRDLFCDDLSVYYFGYTNKTTDRLSFYY